MTVTNPSRVLLAHTSGPAVSPFIGRVAIQVYRNDPPRANEAEASAIDPYTGKVVEAYHYEPGALARVCVTFGTAGQKNDDAPDFFIPYPPSGIPDMERVWRVATEHMRREWIKSAEQHYAEHKED